MKKRLKIVLKICCLLLVVSTVLFFSVGNFVFSFALLRDSFLSKESIITFFNDEMAEDTGKKELSWLELNGEEKCILSEDGLSLRGYYLDNPEFSDKIAIVCHGYDGDATNMSYFAASFYRMGYSVLVPDARAHGKSEGNLVGMGYIEKRDIILWINEITGDKPDAQVILFGVSMGGATVLFTSGESDLPSCVKAVLSDCAYTDVYNEIGSAIRYSVPFVPSFPLVDSASVVCKIRGGYSFRDASCVEAVKRSATPTLFIHGSADNFVPFYMLDVLYDNAACEKEKLVIEGAEHAGSVSTDTELYWSTVTAFINNYII